MPRLRRRTWFAIYLLAVIGIGLVALELAARRLGLGDPILYYNDAWGGIRPLPGQQVRRAGGARVTVDEHGYRVSRRDTAGAIRILYLGDSVTWGGSRVDDAEIFSEVAADAVRASGRPAYAMNAGVNGSSLVNQAEIYQGLAEPVDILVWIFPWGDVTRSYATVGALWPARLKPRFALVEAIDQLLYRFWLGAFRLRAADANAFDTPDLPEGFADTYRSVFARRTERNLDACRMAVQQALRRGIPVVMGVSPRSGGETLLPLDSAAKSFLDEMASAGVVTFDVSDALVRDGRPLDDLFLDEVHFTALGHAVIGTDLGQELLAVLARPQTAPDARSVEPD